MTNVLQDDSRARRAHDTGAKAHDLEHLARWMDSVFEIPFLKLRFGLDALLGLLPGGGDLGAALVSIYILSAANRRGVPRIAILRMALNIAIDMLIGAIPLVGDAFDVYWKANQRNVALLRRHLSAAPAESRKRQRADRLFVAAILVMLCLLLIGSLALTYLAVAWLIAALKGSV